MSITSGFFNSLNGDRRYNTEQMSSLFDGIINDGVFMAIGDRLKVSASGGMTVVVGSGRAWFNHTWTYNDSDFYVSVPASEIVLNRIDAIVLEVNAEETVRKNTIKVVKGSPAANPVAPALTNTPLVKQHPLAHIYVKANASSIATSDITNLVGTSQCPWVTGVVETVDTDELVEQWQARFEEIYAQLENAIEQTLAAEVVDGSITTPKIVDEAVTAAKINVAGLLDKLGGTPLTKANEKLTTFATVTGAKTMSFTVKGAGSASSNAWRRQMITVQAWSQGADFANMQLLVDLVNGAPYGESKCFVTVGRNLSVTSIIYSTSDNDTTYTITFKADAMWALGYVTYKDGQGMSVVGASDISSGSSMVVDNYAAAPAGYGLGETSNVGKWNGDANALTKQGWYRLESGTTNGVGESASVRVEGYAETDLTQTAYTRSGLIKQRTCKSGTWSGWVQCDPSAFAPSGYGLGTNHLTWVSPNSLDSIIVPGWYHYYGQATTLNNVKFNHASLFVYPYEMDPTACVQEIRPYATNTVLRRLYFNNVWRDWECENPPMELGVEYRTTENYWANAVYKKLIYIGKLPNSTEATFESLLSGVADVVSYQITTNASGKCFNRNDIVTEIGQSGDGHVWMKVKTDANLSAYNGYLTVAYTKS